MILVTQAEIAKMARVTRQAVNKWVRREDFPAPARSGVWNKAEVLEWLANRDS